MPVCASRSRVEASGRAVSEMRPASGRGERVVPRHPMLQQPRVCFAAGCQGFVFAGRPLSGNVRWIAPPPSERPADRPFDSLSLAQGRPVLSARKRVAGPALSERTRVEGPVARRFAEPGSCFGACANPESARIAQWVSVAKQCRGKTKGPSSVKETDSRAVNDRAAVDRQFAPQRSRSAGSSAGSFSGWGTRLQPRGNGFPTLLFFQTRAAHTHQLPPESDYFQQGSALVAPSSRRCERHFAVRSIDLRPRRRHRWLDVDRTRARGTTPKHFSNCTSHYARQIRSVSIYRIASTPIPPALCVITTSAFQVSSDLSLSQIRLEIHRFVS